MLAAQMERWVVSFLAWDHALSLLSLYVSHGKSQRNKEVKKKNNSWSQVMTTLAPEVRSQNT